MRKACFWPLSVQFFRGLFLHTLCVLSSLPLGTLNESLSFTYQKNKLKIKCFSFSLYILTFYLFAIFCCVVSGVPH